MTTNVHTAAGAGEQSVDLRDPYPFFAHKRRASRRVQGTVMDYSKTPESFCPRASSPRCRSTRSTRCSETAGCSAPSHTTRRSACSWVQPFWRWKERSIATIATWCRRHSSPRRWPGGSPRLSGRSATRLIDEFIQTGEADLVRNFTFEFPTRVIARLLGLPAEDLPMFRKRAVQLISYHVNYERAFDASAALKDYFVEQIEQRKSKPTEDIIGDLVTAEIDGEKLSDEAIYSFLRLLLPAGLETTYRSSGNLLYLLLTHPDQFAAVQADRELIAPGDRGRAAVRDPADHGATVHDRRHRAGRGRRFRRARWSACASARRIATSSAGSVRRNSTSSASTCRTSPSPPASTPAWACTWRGWKRASRSNAC